MAIDQGSASEEVVDLFLECVDESEYNGRELYELAERNKIGHPFLEHLAASDDAEEWVDDRLAESTAELERFERDASLVASSLDSYGIDYALIKTRFPFPYVSWDVNLLVDEDDATDVVSLLQAEEWYRTSLREHPIARTEPGKWMYEHEERTPVHLHTSVSWNGFEYIPAELVLEDTIEENDLRYPSEEIDWLIHCAHSVFENYELTLGEAFLLDRFEQWSDRETVETLHLSEAANLVEETASTILQVEMETLPVSYDRMRLRRAWREHAIGLYAPIERSLHEAMYTLH